MKSHMKNSGIEEIKQLLDQIEGEFDTFRKREWIDQLHCDAKKIKDNLVRNRLLYFAREIYDVMFYEIEDVQHFLLTEQTPYKTIPIYGNKEMVMYVYKKSDHKFRVKFHKDSNGEMTLINNMAIVK